MAEREEQTKHQVGLPQDIGGFVRALVDREKWRKQHALQDEVATTAVQAIAIDEGNEPVVKAMQDLRAHLSSGEQASTFLDAHPEHGEVSLVEVFGDGAEHALVGILFDTSRAIPERVSGEPGIVYDFTSVVRGEVEGQKSGDGIIDERLGNLNENLAVQELFSNDKYWIEDLDGELRTAKINLARLAVRKDGMEVGVKARSNLMSNVNKGWREGCACGEDPSATISGYGNTRFLKRGDAVNYVLAVSEYCASNRSAFELMRTGNYEGPVKKK